MLDIYNHYCDQEERKRIEKIELLDEYEEWNIMLKHYFVLIATAFNEEVENDEYSKLLIDKVTISN